MKVYSPNEIRNIALLGHSGCGKTSIIEAALNCSGVTSRLGRVDDGNTVSDYDAEEIRRKVSISASVIPIEWQNTKLNFIDTPGYFDFVGEVKQALSVADMALIVVSAKSGVEVGTEKAWEYAEELGLPKMIFVNGMDDENADFNKVVDELQAKFGKSIAPLQSPIKDGAKFDGFVNAIKREAFKFGADGKPAPCGMPAGLSDSVDTLHAMLREAVAETDDELMERFFNDEDFTDEEIERGMNAGLAAGVVTPVLCGSSGQNKGIRVMMDTIIKIMPPVCQISKTVTAKNTAGADVEVSCAENAPASAFVFKTIADPYVGRLTLFKVMSGVIKKDLSLYNPLKDFTEKVAHVYIIRGREQIEVPELKAGDIGAFAKLQTVSTGDTLCSKDNVVIFKGISFPESLMSMAVVPKGKGDEDKIGQSISKLLEEDKTLRFEVNSETKQSLISGIGDTQLEVLVSRLKDRYKLDVELVSPTVPYREMIKSKVSVEGKYKKQSGGHGQFGVVTIEFEPSGDLNGAYVFEERVFGGSVPRQYFPAVEKGIQDRVKAGPLAGYPVVGLKATLVDGKYHPVDSSELAFKMATSLAFEEGFMKAKPTLLEPIARVTVIVPDDYTGDIMGDMNKRRGRILGMDKVGAKQHISAEVPQAEMFKYPTELRSMTQGRGSFTLKFERYEEAPNDVQQKVIESRRRELEKEKE